MIAMNLKEFRDETEAMMARYRALPRHIAKKHMMAAVKRAGKTGVPILKRNTPKQRNRTVFHNRGPAGEYGASKVKGGGLRRAATVKAVYKKTNEGGVVYGVLGYRYGFESRKAIWLEFGTDNGIQPRQILRKTMAEWGGPLAGKLEAEMAAALEKAVREVAAKKNPGYAG
jgi:hypothetical protein